MHRLATLMPACHPSCGAARRAVLGFRSAILSMDVLHWLSLKQRTEGHGMRFLLAYATVKHLIVN